MPSSWEGGVEWDGDVGQGLLARGECHAEKVKGAVLVFDGVARVVGVGGGCRRDDHGVEIGHVGDELGGEEGFREDGEEGGQPGEGDIFEGREIRGICELGDVVRADVGEAGRDFEVYRRESWCSQEGHTAGRWGTMRDPGTPLLYLNVASESHWHRAGRERWRCGREGSRIVCRRLAAGQGIPGGFGTVVGL